LYCKNARAIAKIWELFHFYLNSILEQLYLMFLN
jgi:hypothetical protein